MARVIQPQQNNGLSNLLGLGQTIGGFASGNVPMGIGGIAGLSNTQGGQDLSGIMSLLSILGVGRPGIPGRPGGQVQQQFATGR